MVTNTAIYLLSKSLWFQLRLNSKFIYVKQSNKRDLLDLIRDNIFTIKITYRKIACVPLN